MLKVAKMKDLIESALMDLRSLYGELGVGEGRIPGQCSGCVWGVFVLTFPTPTHQKFVLASHGTRIF